MPRQNDFTGSSDSPIDITRAPLEKDSPNVLRRGPKNYPGYSGELPVLRARKLEFSCTLYQPPLEIREKMFQLTLNWTGYTPPMLVVLRQETALYN